MFGVVAARRPTVSCLTLINEPLSGPAPRLGSASWCRCCRSTLSLEFNTFHMFLFLICSCLYITCSCLFWQEETCRPDVDKTAVSLTRTSHSSQTSFTHSGEVSPAHSQLFSIILVYFFKLRCQKLLHRLWNEVKVSKYTTKSSRSTE